MLSVHDIADAPWLEVLSPQDLFQARVKPHTAFGIAPRRLNGDFDGLIAAYVQPYAPMALPPQVIIDVNHLTELRRRGLNDGALEGLSIILDDIGNCLKYGFKKTSLRLLTQTGYHDPVIYLPHVDIDATNLLCTYTGFSTAAFSPGHTLPLTALTQEQCDTWFSAVEARFPDHNLHRVQSRIDLIRVPQPEARPFSWAAGDLTLHFGLKAKNRTALSHCAPFKPDEPQARLVLLAQP